MRIGLVAIVAILTATIAHGAEPATQPTDAPKPELELLGPVRMANYTRPFAAPKADPHQQYRDRHTYGTPGYYGCYGYWGYGYGCGYPRYGGWFARGPYIYVGGGATSTFYGD